MGREWYLGGKSSKSKRSSSGHVGLDRDTNISATTTTTSAGCMCAVFQLFDFHQFQFASNLQHQNEPRPSIFKPTTTTTTITPFDLPEEPNIPKGAEAPRNSLKSEEGTSLSSIIEDDEALESLNNIQMGINQIKTSSSSGLGNSSSRSNDFGSDTSSNSPGTKTPSLVARLMGLDLLPDHTNVSPITASHHFASSPAAPQKPAPSSTRSARAHNKARHLMVETANSPGTRSLPETPRISSARRSDVDLLHHRLSLQINKENVPVPGLGGGGGAEDSDLLSRLSSLRRKQLKASQYHDHHECENSAKSPGYYARQIVKQVKESVTRRSVGSDITNTVKTRSDHQYHQQQHYSRRDYDLVINNCNAKSGKRSSSSKDSLKLEEQATISSSSCSPRLRFSESKTSTTTTTPSPTVLNKDQGFQVISKPTLVISSSSSSSSSSSAKPQKPEREQEQSKGRRNSVNKGGNGRRVIRQKIMQEETFVFGPTSSASTTISARVGNSVPDKSKCKKTPLSNDLLNFSVVPITLLSLKKNAKDVVIGHDQFVMKQAGAGDADHDVRPGDVAAQESKRIKPTSQSHSKYHSSSHPPPHVLNPPRTCPPPAESDITAAAGDPRGALRRYVARILGRAGVSAASHVSFTNWFSPSHPLDPSIFHRLEIYYSTHFIHNTNPNSHGRLLSLRCNRRLVFDVVDEVLVGVLRPFINLKPWINNYYSFIGANNRNHMIRSKSNNGVIIRSIGMQGSDLIETLCSRVEDFPCKDCQVLEDIDALIDRDLSDINHHHQSTKSQKEVAFEEEGEALVMEIEKDLVDTLVHEMAFILVGNWN